MSRAHVLVASSISLALLTSALPAGAGAFPGQNGKIVYIAGDDVFTVDPDGTDVANLTQSPGLDVENVAASPDGRWIAFNVGSSAVLPDEGLYVMDMGATVIRDVLRNRHDEFVAVGAPAWSPDGDRIAFEAYHYQSFTNELFVVDTDGTDLRRLTNCDCVSTSYPVWSPVGSKIAFVPCCSQTVTTIDADTGATEEIFTPASGYASNLTWSPDGTQLAYDDLIEVYRVPVPNGTPVALTADGPGYYSNPSWSPDGTKILVESNHASQQSNNRDIYAIDAATGIAGGVARVTSALDSEGQPEWAPLCETQCTPTAIAFRVARTRAAVKVTGDIQPAVGPVGVALFKKTSNGWRRLKATTVQVGEEGLFRASFNRPSSGKCKVEARYAGSTEYGPSLAAKQFSC